MVQLILHIYSDYNKRLGAYKISYLLQRDYGIHISVGRVYRLMKKLQLPKMSTEKSKHPVTHSNNGECTNHLCQDFNQKASNLVWVSYITYIKAGGKMVLPMHCHGFIFQKNHWKADTDLVITTFQKAYQKTEYSLWADVPLRPRFSIHCLCLPTVIGFAKCCAVLFKKGYSFDNAVCECFFKYLKKEETN